MNDKETTIMKNFFRYAAVALVGLFALGSCSSDDTDEQSGRAALAQPEVTVRDLTTTGFTLRWNAVEDAGNYTYTLNDGTPATTSACEIVFEELERQTEYVVAVKSCPKSGSGYAESAYTYIHVVTDDMEQLPKPKILLGCAYSSRTVISWSAVPESDGYEYTIGDQTVTTDKRQISLSALGKSKEYTFTVRALSNDPTRFSDSQVSELKFTTSDDDVPTLLVAPVEVISDAVAFDVYATSDVTYYYDVISAALFAKYTPEQIVSAYQQYALEYAQKQGISIQLAMASLLKSGTQTISIMGLTPELSYVAFAFGMDYKGNITSDLSYAPFKTTSDGYSSGPNYGGSSWFTQSFYITNAYASLTGYGWTNSVWSLWKGQDIAKLRYRTLTTKVFSQVFTDPNDKQAIIAFLKDDNYGYQLEDAALGLVNSGTGNNMVTPANMGVSYTQSTLAISSGGEETLCVNSVTTKTSTTAASWFMLKAQKDESFGPTYNTFAALMQGVDVVSARYAFFPATALSGIAESKYPAVIEEYGVDLDSGYIPYINNNGFALVFDEEAGIKPQTEYVVMMTVTNSAGDKLTRSSSVTTDAAPVPPAVTARSLSMRSAMLGQSPAGRAIDRPERFIFPMEAEQLPAGARPDSDLWTLIHNMQILK